MQRDAETCPRRAAGVGRAPRCPECPGPRGLGVHAHPGRHPAGAGAALYSQTARRASEVAALPAWPGMAGRRRARSSRPAETWQGGGSELETERCHGKPPRSRGAGATSA